MNSSLNLAWPIIVTFLIIMGWMPFEGIFWLVTTVGVGITFLWGWVVYQQTACLRSQKVQIRIATFGVLAGLIAPAVVLALMVLKTGIHAHGPEFTAEEIIWITRQFLIWPIAGGIAGLGFGMLATSRST